MPESSFKEHVIFFDGECLLCSRFVRFIIARDRRGRFRFASLESQAGQKARRLIGETEGEPGTVILLANGRPFVKSSAVIRIAANLPGIWKLTRVLLLIPAPLRDAVYNWVARRRYRWFGKQTSCMVPTADIRDRFIDLESSGE